MLPQSPMDRRERPDAEAVERVTMIQAIKFWRPCRRPDCRAERQCCSPFAPCWFDQHAEVAAAIAALHPKHRPAHQARAPRAGQAWEWLLRDIALFCERRLAGEDAGLHPPARRRRRIRP